MRTLLVPPVAVVTCSSACGQQRSQHAHLIVEV